MECNLLHSYVTLFYLNFCYILVVPAGKLNPWVTHYSRQLVNNKHYENNNIKSNPDLKKC